MLYSAKTFWTQGARLWDAPNYEPTFSAVCSNSNHIAALRVMKASSIFTIGRFPSIVHVFVLLAFLQGNRENPKSNVRTDFNRLFYPKAASAAKKIAPSRKSPSRVCSNGREPTASCLCIPLT